MSAVDISVPFTLPCGAVLKNRLIKAATTEGLAHPLSHDPNEKHNRLYEAWAHGGCSLIITGNVMVDARFLECPRNVVIDTNTDLPALARWASACKGSTARAIVQISHPGRQCPPSVSLSPVAPSAVPFRLPQVGVQIFLTPRELTLEEIEDIIERFVYAAKTAVEAGFDGVQLHAAHGYLLSQFLSPHINQRTDKYGGSPEKRRRLLLEIAARTRAAIGPNRILAVKLNSADFQKGGLDNNEAREVVLALSNAADTRVDFIEISGGTYENPIMCPNDQDKGKFMKPSTLAREAYFLEFAEQVRSLTKVPLMVTGGFRTRVGMDNALKSRATDLIGLARPVCMDPDVANKLVRSEIDKVTTYNLSVGFLDGVLVPALNNLWHQKQIGRVADGKQPDHSLGYTETLTLDFVRIYFFDPLMHPTITRVFVQVLAVLVGYLVYRFL